MSNLKKGRLQKEKVFGLLVDIAKLYLNTHHYFFYTPKFQLNFFLILFFV